MGSGPVRRSSGLCERGGGASPFVRGTPCHPPSPWSKTPRPRRRPRLAPSINDLAIRVGTVNGSGSQSANLVLLRALYAMGIPCSGKNVFPSNIEGLADLVPHPRQRQGLRRPPARPAGPRLHERADRRRRRPPAQARVDLHLPRRHRRGPDAVRDDVRFFAVPFQKLAEQAYPPDKKDKGVPRQAPQGRQHGLRGRRSPTPAGSRWRRSRRASAASSPAARRRPPRSTSPPRGPGFDWAEANLPDRPALPRRADRRRRADKILIEGNKAAALGVALRRRERADLVPDHPVEQPGRVRRGVPQEAPGRPRRQADLRRRPGRGRAGGHRHGHRRRLGRRAGADGDRRARASR